MAFSTESITANRTVIELDHITMKYGSKTVLDDVSMSLHRGECLALLGPNGAGKSTSVEIMMGLRKPSSGVVRVFGHDPLSERAKISSRIGVMLQDGGVWPASKPRELLDFYASLYPDPVDVGELIERLNLDVLLDTSVRHLSGGQRQLLSLSLALIGRPELLILDEPTAAIDITLRPRIWELLEEWLSAGTSILLTTHFMPEAEELADTVAMLRGGSIVDYGSLEELSERFNKQIVLKVVGGSESANKSFADEVVSRIGLVLSEVKGSSLVFDTSPDLAHTKIADIAILAGERGVAISSIQAGATGLEELFLDVNNGSDVRLP